MSLIAPESEPSPALDIASVSHAFGSRKALDDVTLAIGRAQHCILLGQNGAGKTTLFCLITRLYNNATGSIRIFGLEVRARPSQALGELGVVFQQRTIDLDLSVMQNLPITPPCTASRRREAKRRAEDELVRFDMAERARDKVRQLSGGQMRRVEIARALLHRPRLLLLDEPTVGLDIGSRQAILEHVRGCAREEGIGVLWATHLIDEVGAEDQVILHPAGRVLAQGDGDVDLRPGQDQRPARRLHQAHGARGMTEALARAMPTRCPDERREPRSAGPGHRPFGPCPLLAGSRGDHQARGPALRPPARPLLLGAGPAAGLAVHLRRGLPLGARRLDPCRPTRPTSSTRSTSRRACAR